MMFSVQARLANSQKKGKGSRHFRVPSIFSIDTDIRDILYSIYYTIIADFQKIWRLLFIFKLGVSVWILSEVKTLWVLWCKELTTGIRPHVFEGGTREWKVWKRELNDKRERWLTRVGRWMSWSLEGNLEVRRVWGRCPWKVEGLHGHQLWEFTTKHLVVAWGWQDQHLGRRASCGVGKSLDLLESSGFSVALSHHFWPHRMMLVLLPPKYQTT